MNNVIEVKIPDIGGSTDVNVAEVYVKPGDIIKIDDNLLMLETDKATMEVPSNVNGVVDKVVMQVGNKVNEGDLILLVKSDATAVKSDETKAETKVEHTASQSNMVDTSSVAAAPLAFRDAHASPSIRKLARELGVDLTQVSGSADKGRITESDVKSFVKNILSTVSTHGTVGNGTGLNLIAWPKVDFAKFGAIETTPMSRIKKLSGANLLRNWVMIPHVTQFDEADITNMEDFRKSLNIEYASDNVKISPLAFLIKASVFALKKFPEFNASIDNDNIIYKKYYNIGFAADTSLGLVVPVIKNADNLGILDISKQVATLAKNARDGKLSPQDMQGGTFTISSLGGIGGTGFTPIINAPEVAILGVSKSSIKPIWQGNEFKPCLMMPLSLSYDHRIIDGALAARFTAYLCKLLSDVRQLIV